MDKPLHSKLRSLLQEIIGRRTFELNAQSLHLQGGYKSRKSRRLANMMTHTSLNSFQPLLLFIDLWGCIASEHRGQVCLSLSTLAPLDCTARISDTPAQTVEFPRKAVRGIEHFPFTHLARYHPLSGFDALRLYCYLMEIG